MGWAKYYEDNVEIFLDRQDLRQDHLKERRERRMADPAPLPVSHSLEKRNQRAGKPIRKDEIICCADCGKKILFPVSRQLEYERKGWDPPKRCKKCRDRRTLFYLMR